MQEEILQDLSPLMKPWLFQGEAQIGCVQRPSRMRPASTAPPLHRTRNAPNHHGTRPTPGVFSPRPPVSKSRSNDPREAGRMECAFLLRGCSWVRGLWVSRLRLGFFLFLPVGMTGVTDLTVWAPAVPSSKVGLRCKYHCFGGTAGEFM